MKQPQARPTVHPLAPKHIMTSRPSLSVLPTTAVVRPTTGQVSTDLGGEVAILHIESGKYFALNGVGARVWELVANGSTIDDILATLLDEFDIDAERCERDLTQLLLELEERRLVEIDRTAVDA
jgi:hypothetical protein